MHISEGVLSVQVCAGGYAIAAVITAATLRKVRERDIPKISVVTAAVFVASLFSVKLGVTSVHLLLNGLAGILLGYGAFPAIVVALFFQAIMFAHGGIIVLGINSLVMGIPALLAFFAFRLRKLWKSEKLTLILAFAIGVGYVAITVLLGVSALVFANKEFLATAKLLAFAHIPVMITEGVICLLVVRFLQKVKPEILEA